MFNKKTGAMNRAENVRTVAGLVNREVLGELKRGFDRRALLVLNHRLDELARLAPALSTE